MRKILGIDDQAESPDDYREAVAIDGIYLASIKHLGPYKCINKSRE